MLVLAMPTQGLGIKAAHVREDRLTATNRRW
jgi:hypothetical protein